MLSKLIKNREFGKGLYVSICRDSLFSGVYLGTYGYFRDYFPKERFYYSLSGFISGSLTWFILIPIDTIRTIIQGDREYMLKNVKSNPLLLWRGLLPMIVRSGPVNFINMALYEEIRKYIN